MGTPNHTLDLLRSLKARGFDDLAFSHLHHWRAAGRIDTIDRHASYCSRIKEFRAGGNNERVQRRLELVLGACGAGGFTSGRQDVFVALAEAAWREVPHPAEATTDDE